MVPNMQLHQAKKACRKKYDNEAWREKINQWKLDQLQFDEKKQQVVKNIEKTCTDNVQQEILAMKNLTKKAA